MNESLCSDKRLCACGCKSEVYGYNSKLKRPHEYVHGHNSKGKEFVPRNLVFCACGCGEKILDYKYGGHLRFKQYHQPKLNNHHHWKGGKAKHADGYILIRCEGHPAAGKDNYILEHRLIVEKHLHRYLERDEIVHHVNGIKTDNRIENLQLMTRSTHVKLHPKIRGKDGRFL